MSEGRVMVGNEPGDRKGASQLGLVDHAEGVGFHSECDGSFIQVRDIT